MSGDVAPEWTAVGRAAEWPEEGGRLVTVGARRIGVYRHAGGWYALKDVCPHAGVSLVRGPVKDGAVQCVGHGWRFSLASGEVVAGPKGFRVATYPVRTTPDGAVEIGL